MSSPDPGQEPAPKFYSKDYWDLVFEQLGKNLLFKISMVVLALLYASAIYAPFVANDRPYSIEAIDYKEYGAATKGLRSVCSSVVRQAEKTSESYLETRGEDAPATLADALNVELQALVLRTDTMKAYLPESEHAPLIELVAQVKTVIAASTEGDVMRATELAKAAKGTASELKKSYVAQDPEGDESTGKILIAVKSYPLWVSITPGWMFLMAFWALILSWPVWNRLTNTLLLAKNRERIRKARRWKLAFALGVPIVIAVGWFGINGSGETAFDVSNFKLRLTEGEIVATSEPVFAPIPMGYAETHTEEKFRPPTWTHESQIDERGRYMFGLKAITEEDEAKAKEAGEFVPPAVPVTVRAGEPGRNSPMRHLGGTDELGRDFFARLLWGGRVSLAVGILSAFLLTIIGVVIGSIAGYFGGWVDILIMRLIEVLQSIPAFFLILMVMAMVPPTVMPPIFAIVIVIALIRWTGVARLVRGEFLRLREQEFVLAAQALGFSSRRTIFKHVLPNALSPILVSAAFAVASGILTESAISFLGFGTQAPKASWGSLVNESQSPEHWWIQIFPGLVIFVTVTCYNLAGDAVRDALDPKMKD
jgi:peptide/nickel transport system permease protein